MMHSYIGVLINDSGTFDIADPMINPITCDQLQVPRENQTILKVRNVLPGMYNAWHTINDNDEVCDLLLLHHTYSFENLLDNLPFCLGNVCAALSHAVCVVDERYHFDPSYSYYKLESDAFYDGDEIIKRLSTSAYPEDIKERLHNMILSLKDKSKQPTGEDIYKSTKGYDVWDALRSNKIYSSHWSVDVCNRLKGCLPAAVFKGGVISKSDPCFLSSYVYRNSRAMAFAISISLEMIEMKDINDIGGDIINFPKKSDNIKQIDFSG